MSFPLFLTYFEIGEITVVKKNDFFFNICSFSGYGFKYYINLAGVHLVVS